MSTPTIYVRPRHPPFGFDTVAASHPAEICLLPNGETSMTGRRGVGVARRRGDSHHSHLRVRTVRANTSDHSVRSLMV